MTLTRRNYTLVAAIYAALKKKKKYLPFTVTSNQFKLLNQLRLFNLISNYKIIYIDTKRKRYKLIISLTYHFGYIFYSKISFFMKTQKRMYITLKTLKTLFKHKTNFFFILSTPMGLITHRRALDYNLTGFIYLIVYL